MSAGEYGTDYIDRMIGQVDNGKCVAWTPDYAGNNNDYGGVLPVPVSDQPMWDPVDAARAGSTSWEQFCILYRRRTIQMFRDSVRLELNEWYSSISRCFNCLKIELPETEDLHEPVSGDRRERHVSRCRK